MELNNLWILWIIYKVIAFIIVYFIWYLGIKDSLFFDKPGTGPAQIPDQIHLFICKWLITLQC